MVRTVRPWSGHRTVPRQRRPSYRSILFRVSTVLFFPKQGYGAWCSGLEPLSSCSLTEHAYFVCHWPLLHRWHTGSVIRFHLTKLAAVGRSCWNAFLLKLEAVNSFTVFDQRMMAFFVTASVTTLAITPWDSKPNKCFVASVTCCRCIQVVAWEMFCPSS